MEKTRFSENYTLHIIILGYLVFWVIMSISPHNRNIWFLEHLLIFLFFGFLALTYYRFQFSNLSYAMIALFFALHTYGASYSYSTPFDAWIKGWVDLSRDYYDRIVHFSFGLLIVLPVYEFFSHVIKIPKKWIGFFSVITILAAGAFYELIEMWTTFIVAPELGTMFVGLQGDPWDSHHDMELAMYGAIITLVVKWGYPKVRKFRLRLK